MRATFALAAAVIAAGSLLASAPAAAKTCKDVVTAKGRSAAQLSDASRERRARDTYGWRYSFWRRADEQQVNCGGGASARHCTVSAKPCRLL
jgi:hypothetical protein